MWSNRTQVHCCWGCENGQPLWEACLILCEMKLTLTRAQYPHSVNSASRSWKPIFTGGCPHRKLHVDAYGSFVHNCQNLKQLRHPSAGKEKQKRATFKQWDAIPRLERNALPAMMRRGGGFNARD